MTIGFVESVNCSVLLMNLFINLNLIDMKTNYENATMLDMIFEQRNKAYGAYQIRQNYSSRVRSSMLIMFTALFLLCFGKIISDKLKGGNNHHTGHDVTVNVLPPVDLAQKKVEIVPPKPPKPVESQGIQTQRNTDIQVVTDSHMSSDSVPTVEQMRDVESGINTNLNGNTIGATDGKGKATSFEPVHETAATGPTVLITAEVMPVFPGGEGKLMEFLANHTEYPPFEKEMGIEGKTYAKFVVNEDGSISNTEIIRSESKGFSTEAKRVVALLPKFSPGMQQGRPVKVQFVLPFSFKLGNP